MASLSDRGVTTTTHTSLRGALKFFAENYDSERDAVGAITGKSLTARESTTP